MTGHISENISVFQQFESYDFVYVNSFELKKKKENVIIYLTEKAANGKWQLFLFMNYAFAEVGDQMGSGFGLCFMPKFQSINKSVG